MVDLTKVRNALNLTLAEVAYRAGVSIALVWGLEKNRVDRTKMFARTRKALSAVYGVDLITGEAMGEVRETASSAT